MTLRSAPIRTHALVLAAALAVTGATVDRAIAATPEPPEVSVSTFAGTGDASPADGPVATAGFVMPAGLAVAPDGSIYVTDIGAQTIRHIVKGKVETVAGMSTPGTTPLLWKGGYADGPAHSAQFDRPEGIAVGRDGKIYIADSLNHCIRLLHDGMVTTFAGSPEKSGRMDGTGKHAQFGVPKSLAVDDAGNVYVADSYVGIRKITPSGVVTTLDLPMSDDKRLAGIAVKGSGDSLVIVYSDMRNVYYNRGSDREAESFLATNLPWDEDENIGYSFALTIVGDKAIVMTDLASNSVKYLHFADRPFFPSGVMIPFAAGRAAGQWTVGGYVDGPSSIARLNAPYGIGRLPDGTIVVADSGNRRVRAFTGIDTKTFTKPDLSDLHFRPNSYRIMAIGDSNMWASVMWKDSMPGIIEDGLRRDAAKTGLKKDPDVEFVSIAGIGLHAAESFVDNDFSDGEVDLVVLFVDDYYVLNDKQLEPNEGWRTAVPAQFLALQKKLAQNHTRLAFVVLPTGRSVAPYDQLRAVEMDIDPATYDYELSLRTARAFQDIFSSSGVHCVAPLDSFIAAEESPAHGAYFDSFDHHMTPEGSAWVADYTLTDLEQWAPWTQ